MFNMFIWMEMKNKIKEIYNKLSSSEIDSFDSVINTSSFSSVLKDRFVSELKKLNIHWDMSPTTINKLVKSVKATNSSSNSSKLTIPETKIDNGIYVGIDLQFINHLPVVKDPWEDQFYKDNFNKNEIAHCLKKKNIYESFAGIFAIKEAIYKIDGTEKKDIKLKFLKDGKPINSKYSISISHDEDYAVGVAVLNKEKNYLNEIRELNTKIDHNSDSINKLEIKPVLNSNKSIKIIYFFIVAILSYIFYRDFFSQWI